MAGSAAHRIRSLRPDPERSAFLAPSKTDIWLMCRFMISHGNRYILKIRQFKADFGLLEFWSFLKIGMCLNTK